MHEEREQALDLAKSSEDVEMRQLARQEAEELRERKATLSAQLEIMLVPPDPLDEKSTIVEVRAGTGGDVNLNPGTTVGGTDGKINANGNVVVESTLTLAAGSITDSGALTVAATGAVLSLDGTTIQTSASAITGDDALTITSTSAGMTIEATSTAQP